MADDAAHRMRDRVVLAKDTAHIGSSNVSGRLPVRLRHTGTWIVTEESRSATAAMWTSQYGLAVGHLFGWLIGRFR